MSNLEYENYEFFYFIFFLLGIQYIPIILLGTSLKSRGMVPF